MCVLGLKQPKYSTFSRYQDDCAEKKLVPLPREIYTQMCFGNERVCELKGGRLHVR